MPEDEAIDFTFKMGVDTAHGVAQSMSEESTLKREDVPQGTIKQKTPPNRSECRGPPPRGASIRTNRNECDLFLDSLSDSGFFQK